jgi:HSP20 family molecular chaperone IbpA
MVSVRKAYSSLAMLTIEPVKKSRNFQVEIEVLGFHESDLSISFHAKGLVLS